MPKKDGGLTHGYFKAEGGKISYKKFIDVSMSAMNFDVIGVQVLRIREIIESGKEKLESIKEWKELLGKYEQELSNIVTGLNEEELLVFTKFFEFENFLVSKEFVENITGSASSPDDAVEAIGRDSTVELESL